MVDALHPPHGIAARGGGKIGRSWSIMISLASFGLATACAYLAQANGRPISAVLIYIVGVTTIGAISGLRGGVAAALVASGIYNFFLSEPLLQFGAASIDEYVPLVAFNLAAVLSGALAGRLNDRVRAAEDAQARVNLLLTISSRLQNAVRVVDVAEALRDHATVPWLADAAIHDLDGRRLCADGPAGEVDTLARAVAAGSIDPIVRDGRMACRLATANGPVGVVMFERLAPAAGDQGADIGALVNLLSLAVERCALLEQRTEAAAVRRSEELKTALLSSMSHDMRSPLAAIAASASALASFSDDLDPDVRRQMLRTIQEQCERLNRYTAHLLDMGLLQGGIGPERLAPVDVVEILGAVIASARTADSDHHFTKDIACAEAIVLANAVMIEQLLGNVVENAVRYSPPDSVIHVAAAIAGDDLRLVVEDEGCGIPAEDLPHVFERFFRSPGVAPHEGQGLGLSIAKGFAEAFGGTIALASPCRDGRGTCATILLPLAHRAGIAS